MNKITPDYLRSLAPSHVGYIEAINDALVIAAESGRIDVTISASQIPVASRKKIAEHYIDSGFSVYLEGYDIVIKW